MALGLLQEVSQLLASRLTIMAADQVYFGGKQVYGNIPLSVSTASTSACDKKHDSSGDAHKGGDVIKLALSDARSIVDAALVGGRGATASVGNTDSARILVELETLRKENADIKREIASLKEVIFKIQSMKLGSDTPATASAPAKVEEEAGDEDFDLFGSDDEEDEEKKKVVEERLKAYAEKKSKKPGPIAKSSVILDVKPWDDETDLAEMEKLVRGIVMDGLVWGGGKLVAIGYGIQKLQIISVVEDEKVSVDDLIEKIGEFEDHVQSVDIVAFNKI